MTEHGLSCSSQPLRMPIGGQIRWYTAYYAHSIPLPLSHYMPPYRLPYAPKRQPPIPRIYVSMLNIVYILFACKDTTFFLYNKHLCQKICLTTFDAILKRLPDNAIKQPFWEIYLFQKRDICVGIEGVSGLGVDLGVGWVSGGCWVGWGCGFGVRWAVMYRQVRSAQFLQTHTLQKRTGANE